MNEVFERVARLEEFVAAECSAFDERLRVLESMVAGISRRLACGAEPVPPMENKASEKAGIVITLEPSPEFVAELREIQRQLVALRRGCSAG